MASAVFLLGEGERFGGQALPVAVARVLGRANARHGEAGPHAQLRRHVRLLPDHWPLAALARQRDAGDAGSACWLRADPAHVQPDINGARLLACGDGVQVSREDADALLPALKPLFGDAGMPIDAPLPGHWYLRLQREARLPAFREPADALGDDIFDHLPDGEAGRRWRALLSEAQVLLHNHPRNRQRAERGLPPVNSLWFWGAGALPDSVSTPHACVLSDDEVLHALVHGATPARTLPARFEVRSEDTLHDLRTLRDLSRLSAEWLQPALDALGNGGIGSLTLDLADGQVFEFARAQRWRFWRQAVHRFG